MESIRQMALHDPLKLVAPLCLLLGTVAAGYLVKRLLFRALRRWGEKSASNVHTVLTQSLNAPILIWSLIAGIYFATEILDLPERSIHVIERTLLILTIVSLTMMASRLAGNLIRHYGGRVPGAMPVTTLTQNLAQLFVVLLGLLIVLHQLGVHSHGIRRGRPGGGAGIAGHALQFVRGILREYSGTDAFGRLHQAQYGRRRVYRRHKLAQHDHARSV
jgi:hypothetical protein